MPSFAALLGGVRGTIALPGYFIADTPWAGVKTNTGFDTRAQSSGYLSGGSWYNGGSSQNDLFSADHWFAAGTYKFPLLFRKYSQCGIVTVSVGATNVGTVDTYSAATQENQFDETVTGAITAGLYAFQFKMATKNASSSNYRGDFMSRAAIRTGA